MLQAAEKINHVDFLSGALLLVNKPAAWTSFDVVNKIRFRLRQLYKIKNIKVGHAGTLDPMATGLLLVCTGRWTKKLHLLQGLDKKYDAGITLGIETDTYDAEGKIIFTRPVPVLEERDINLALLKFHGGYDQYPPAFSAIKKEGKPLYALAREGKEVIVEPRKVIVHEIQLKSFERNYMQLSIHCGSGFYVRSLAHDIGQHFGCGAHLSALTRTAVGPYGLENAWEMEDLINAFTTLHQP